MVDVQLSLPCPLLGNRHEDGSSTHLAVSGRRVGSSVLVGYLLTNIARTKSAGFVRCRKACGGTPSRCNPEPLQVRVISEEFHLKPQIDVFRLFGRDLQTKARAWSGAAEGLRCSRLTQAEAFRVMQAAL